MLVLSDICDDYDEMEKIVERHSFNALYERYNGFNLTEDQFDIETDKYLFTIKRRINDGESCILSNGFEIWINGEWITFERW